MTSEILVYLRLGFEHITDVGGYDHLLFVAALTASDLGRFRRLFWLVTAFTVGHSITLVLATLDLVRISSSLVEVLIPLTILATSVVNAAPLRRGAMYRPPAVGAIASSSPTKTTCPFTAVGGAIQPNSSMSCAGWFGIRVSRFAMS